MVQVDSSMGSGVPLSQHGVPWLVYPSQGTKRAQEKFYSFVDGQIVVERYAYHYNHYMCVAVADNWMLLQGHTSCKKMFLFNPFTSKKFPLPRMNEDPDLFFILSNPSKTDCFIVAIYDDGCPYFLYASPRGKRWKKHNLTINGDYFSILSACTDNRKVYLLDISNLLCVIKFASCPIIEYFETTLIPFKYYNISKRCSLFYELVASFGDLFLVMILVYENTNLNLVRSMMVLKLDFSSKMWTDSNNLNNCVFLVGVESPFSFIVTNTNFKENCIYYVLENVLYCFNMTYGSLTASYPFSDETYKICYPFWLLYDDGTQLNHEKERYEIKEKPTSLSCSYDKFLFGHHRFLQPPTSNSVERSIKQYKIRQKWHPRTPWLMFTHKDDGKYKVMNPCSKTVYELLIPELSASMIFASVHGWLFVQDRFRNFFFLNLLSKEKINISCLDHGPFGVAFSAPPTNSECKIFFISQLCDGTLKISICQPYSNKRSTREFENTAKFKISNSNAVYLNGCFYCLGMDGNLGVYDPINDSWRLLGTSIGNHKPHYCTLVESQGKLLSVFIDLFQRPIGIFEFDLDLYHWKRVTDMGDRTFFFGEGASLCVTAPTESTRNMIYFPTFGKECNLDLVTYPLSRKEIVQDLSTHAKTGYIHVWIEPKFRFNVASIAL